MLTEVTFPGNKGSEQEGLKMAAGEARDRPGERTAPVGESPGKPALTPEVWASLLRVRGKIR